MLSPSAPLIGVVADQKTIERTDRSDSARLFVGVYSTYLSCLAAAGALPVMIPLGLPADILRGIYDRVDGLVLPGGGDVDPSRYGETTVHEAVCEINPARDTDELLLSKWAVEDDKPLLGICRGHQVLNVALGGTLVADIPSLRRSNIAHDTHGQHPLNYPAHVIDIAAGSRLSQILGGTVLPTNSRHHQAVDRLGEGLVAVATSPDGIVEALEKPDARFVVTVQWHPENMCGESPAMHALFAALVTAATAYRTEERSTLQAG